MEINLLRRRALVFVKWANILQGQKEVLGFKARPQNTVFFLSFSALQMGE